MTRIDVIKFLIKRFNYKSYLEIGVQDMNCFKEIEIEKVGVEPNPLPDSRIFRGTSDQFFSQNNKTFDIIFIDGDHNYEAVIRDIRNAFKFLNEGGSVVCHDSMPAVIGHLNPYVNGTVYKALMEIRSEVGYSFCTLADDFGVCVIRSGGMLPMDCKDFTFEQFKEKEQFILNTHTWEEFVKHFL